MNTTISLVAPSQVRQSTTHSRRDLMFSKAAMSNLSLLDQHLFQKFGTGAITDVPYDCIHHAFEDHVRANPTGIAVRHLDQQITYKALNDQANIIALELIKNGVKPGDNVGIFLKRSISMVAGILGILKAGACYVPQDVVIATDEYMKYIIEQANIKVVLTLAQYRDLVPESPNDTCIEIDTFLTENEGNTNTVLIPNVETTANDLCYMIFTSGTTGKPNGVQVTHGNLCNLLLTNPGNLGMRPGLKVSQILNIAFDMSVWEILGCLSNGATLIIRNKDMQETISQVDIVVSTPSILAKIDASQCQNVKTVAVAGEPCPRTLAERWSAFSVFYNSCGPTEITIVNTAERFFPGNEILSIGRPTPNNTVYILDENLKPCNIGETGEMWAGGRCVTAGYIGNEQLTTERYVDDPFLENGQKMFRTRDLGRWTRKGELEHLGRTDDQVKIKGFRVELDAISAVVESLPECIRAASLKIDNETLATFATPQHLDIQEITGAVAEALPYYYVPKIVIPLEALPMTDRGKIDKRQLLRQVEEYKINKIQPQKPPVKLDGVELPKQQGLLRRMWKGETLMHYHRLLVLVMLANIALAVYGYTEGWWAADNIRLDILSKITIVNFALGILMRQQYVVNLLFKIATSVPINWSLNIRRRAGKVYHFGGIHVGGTVSGTVWFIAFVACIYYDFFNHPSTIIGTSLLVVTTLLCAILIGIIALALPQFRAKNHDTFEKSHRFGGWAALLLFWAQMMIFVSAASAGQGLGMALISSVEFWILVLITFSIALPWMRLKKVKVDITRPSNHVVLARFNYGETPFAGSSTTLSRNPLMEWHSFANVPEPGTDGFRLTISRAGDWTGKLIDDMPEHLWVKGITTAGVGNVDKLFKRVVWVATGSGIGPCLPHLLSQEVPARLVWATRSPRKTYGDDLIDDILRVQPDAIIWDTDKFGKPDMVKLAYKVYQEFDAEAVICISNKKLTWKVVYGMESRNIPAYGAIWDS